MNLFELTVYTVRENTLPVFLSIRSADQYLFDNLGWYASAMHVIRDLPPEAHVLMLWEPRSLYCLPKCQPDEVLDRWLVELHSNTAHYRQGTGAPVSMDDILQSWRKKGYTHLLLSTIGASFERQNNSNYDSQDWQQLDSLLQSLPTPVEFGEAYFLYPLPP